MDPHFRYCCPVWGVAGATEISHLQKLQNRAARIITNSRYDAPSDNLIKQLGWSKIDEMIQYESRVMVYKSVNELAPHNLNDLFIRNIENPSYELRNTATDLQIPKRYTANGQKGFSFRGAKLWNSLSTEIKSERTITNFKTALYIMYSLLCGLIIYLFNLFLIFLCISVVNRFFENFYYFVCMYVSGGPLENQLRLKCYPP